MRHFVFFVFFVLLGIATNSAFAKGQIYFYEDESGGLHFTDSPDKKSPFKPYLFFNTARKEMPASEFASLITTYCDLYDMDKDLVRAVIKVESNFRPKAVSNAGAQGLMQIMPSTAKELGLDRPFEPEDNLEAGIRYLRILLDYFVDIPLALAAYNAGPENVKKYGGIPPFTETQNYVQKVLQHYHLAKSRN